jgi:hypothetical protein
VLHGRVLVTILYVCFRSTLVVFIFCLMNLMMISQTAQSWSSDGVSSSLRSEKEIFGCLASENERLTVFVCYHHAVRGLNCLSRCIEKSHFGAVTFG